MYIHCQLETQWSGHINRLPCWAILDYINNCLRERLDSGRSINIPSVEVRLKALLDVANIKS